MYIGYYGAYYNSPSGGLGPTYYIGYSPLRPYFNDSTTAALTTGACRRLGAYGGGGTPQYNIVFSSGGIGGPIDPYILGVEGNGYSAGTALKLGYGGGYYYNLYGANYQLYQCVVSYPGALTTYVLDGGGYGGYTTPVFSWGNFPPRNGMCITGAGAGYGGHYSAGYAGVLQPAGIVYDSWGDGCGTYPYAAGGYGTNAYGHFYDVGDDDLLGNRFGVGLFNSENAPFIRADGSIYQTYIDASAQANEGGVLSPTVASYAASYAGTSSLLVRIVSPAGAVSTTAAIASGSFTGSSAGEADAALGCSHYVQAASAFIGDMSATAAGFVVYMVFDGNSTLLTAGAGIIASYYVATISADANGVYSGTPVKIATPIALSTLFKTTPYAVPWAQDNLSMSTAGAGFVWFVVSGVLFACEAATGILYSSPLAQPDGVYSVVWLGGQRVEIRSTHGTEGRYLDPAAGVIGSSGVIFRSAFSAATLGTTAPTAQFEPRGCVLPIARGDSKYLLPY